LLESYRVATKQPPPDSAVATNGFAVVTGDSPEDWVANTNLPRNPPMTDEWVIAVLGGAVAGLASALAATRAAIDTPSFASAALYLFAAAYSLWVSRAEQRLAARWPIIVLTRCMRRFCWPESWATRPARSSTTRSPPRGRVASGALPRSRPGLPDRMQLRATAIARCVLPVPVPPTSTVMMRLAEVISINNLVCLYPHLSNELP
jgi:hypothetical protein